MPSSAKDNASGSRFDEASTNWFDGLSDWLDLGLDQRKGSGFRAAWPNVRVNLDRRATTTITCNRCFR